MEYVSPVLQRASGTGRTITFSSVAERALPWGERPDQWFPRLAVHPNHMEKITTSSPHPDTKMQNFLSMRSRNLLLTHPTAEPNASSPALVCDHTRPVELLPLDVLSVSISTQVCRLCSSGLGFLLLQKCHLSSLTSCFLFLLPTSVTLEAV